MYSTLKKQYATLCDADRNIITNASSLAALLFSSLENLNWAGFYFLNNGSLKLGPFQGKPACIDIPEGKGVCGTAVQMCKSLIVDDVHEFPGHIACDEASQSEIVIPLFYKGRIIGVLDIDSPVKSRFTEADRPGLEELVKILLEKSDIVPLRGIYRF